MEPAQQVLGGWRLVQEVSLRTRLQQDVDDDGDECRRREAESLCYRVIVLSCYRVIVLFSLLRVSYLGRERKRVEFWVKKRGGGTCDLPTGGTETL